MDADLGSHHFMAEEHAHLRLKSLPSDLWSQATYRSTRILREENAIQALDICKIGAAPFTRLTGRARRAPKGYRVFAMTMGYQESSCTQSGDRSS
jgi:hypothetical protein